jgi:hypothetical protein
VDVAVIPLLFAHKQDRLVASLVPTIRNRINQATKHISPLIRHRREQIELLGEEYERPVNFLAILLIPRESKLSFSSTF